MSHTIQSFKSSSIFIFIYSALVLFAGFVIFIWSNFGGTIALGKLTSITLMISMFTNIIFLPALLLAFDHGRHRKDHHPLIESYEDIEQEDEEINVDLIKVEKNNADTTKIS